MTIDRTWLDDALKRTADGGASQLLMRIALDNMRPGESVKLSSSLILLSGSVRFSEQEVDALQEAAAILRSKDTA